jgi:hypothetical protein
VNHLENNVEDKEQEERMAEEKQWREDPLKLLEIFDILSTERLWKRKKRKKTN